jgi:hypothetical protein
MIEENSGKFFRFKLDFDLGFGFAEVYDFTDAHSADGVIVFVYNRVDTGAKKTYTQTEITESGIALGPITLFRYPGSRGVGAWKYLFQTDTFLINERPVRKDAQDLAPWIYNWNILKRWHKTDWNVKESPVYVPYQDVRSMETGILNSTNGVVIKTTMKILIDKGLSVADYYDLTELGNRNMYVALINTYYPLEITEQLICALPLDVHNTA